MAAEGHALGKTNVSLQAGENQVRLHAALNTPGALDLSIAVRSGVDSEVRYDQAVMLRRPKILYVSQDNRHHRFASFRDAGGSAVRHRPR